MAEDHNGHVEVLKLVYADVEKERDRLRNARASWTSRLAPLPAAAALATGTIADGADKVDQGWVVAAAALFAVLLVVSWTFSGLKPYREFRADRQAAFYPRRPKQGFAFCPQETDLERWLEMKIRVEERICGAPGERQSRRWPTRRVKSLTHALNAERAATNIVYVLSLFIFAVLSLGAVLS